MEETRIKTSNIGSKYLTLEKAGQRLRAEGILIPHLHKALSLAASLLESFQTFWFYLRFRKNILFILNNLHLIKYYQWKACGYLLDLQLI